MPCITPRPAEENKPRPSQRIRDEHDRTHSKRFFASLNGKPACARDGGERLWSPQFAGRSLWDLAYLRKHPSRGRFQGDAARIYEALTDEKKFSQVTDFIIKGASTEISRDVGGSFTIFGGVISGRHIELIPDERIVQAWREKDWLPGIYSIVKFQLDEQGADTKLVFDHSGFPQGASASLAPGWWSHYWEPLQKYLA